MQTQSAHTYQALIATLCLSACQPTTQDLQLSIDMSWSIRQNATNFSQVEAVLFVDGSERATKQFDGPLLSMDAINVSRDRHEFRLDIQYTEFDTPIVMLSATESVDIDGESTTVQFQSWTQADTDADGVGDWTEFLSGCGLTTSQTGCAWLDVAVGDEFACGITKDRLLTCWGRSDRFQTGDSTVWERQPPFVFAGAQAWSNVEAGAKHACAIEENGTLWCWGSDDNGRLGARPGGNEPGGSQATPLRIDPPDAEGGVGRRWVNFSVGAGHTCAITNDHNLFCWGDGPAFGDVQLDVETPKLVSAGHQWQTVAAGGVHTCGITTLGDAYCMGINQRGEVSGLGTPGDVSVPTPFLIDGTTETLQAKQVFVGDGVTCLRRSSDDALVCWGNNVDQQITAGGNSPVIETAIEGMASAPDSLSIGLEHLCYVLAGGLVCRGNSRYGKTGSLGPGPQTVSSGDWAQVSAGATSTCARDKVGALKCWGSHQFGQVGAPIAAVTGTGLRRVPTEILITSQSGPPQSLSAGAGHTCFVDDNGELFCWGTNRSAQLGLDSASEPAVILFAGSAIESASPLSGQIISASTAGTSHHCVIANMESWCWGANDLGQGGQGTEGASTSIGPMRVHGALTGALSDAASYYAIDSYADHTCAIPVDEAVELHCWGDNQFGQSLVTGPAIAPTPQVTEFEEAVMYVAVGTGHSCGATSTEVRCWGDNGRGQMVGVEIESTGVFRAAFAEITDLEAGAYHTCAITGVAPDNRVQCWGADDGEQLGENITDGVSSIAPQDAASGWSTLVAGAEHTCGLEGNGDLYCWGSNFFGQLGQTDLGRNPSSRTKLKVAIPNDEAVVAVSAGPFHTCVLTDDLSLQRNLYCWGSNELGQLGTGNALTTMPTTVQPPDSE